MLDRRLFTASVLTGAIGASLPPEASLALERCSGSCFNSDFPQLGYDKFFRSIFDLARNQKLNPVASGTAVRPELESILGPCLYRPLVDSIVVERNTTSDGIRLSRISFDLECGVPVVGCLGLPNVPPRGLILLCHGIGSVPERCFTDAQPDYMKALGKRLCQDGYAVWCPYILQEGNQKSQNLMAAMLLSRGISLHNVSCSALNAGELITKEVTKLSDLTVGCYGVSWGSFLVLHLEAATQAHRPTVASGYMRDETKFLSSLTIENLNFEFATYIHFKSNEFKFAGAKLAQLLQPSPLYIEIGDQDTWNSNRYGRDQIFSEMQSVYKAEGKGSEISIGVFNGPHEAHGVESREWLKSRV